MGLQTWLMAICPTASIIQYKTTTLTYACLSPTQRNCGAPWRQYFKLIYHLVLVRTDVLHLDQNTLRNVFLKLWLVVCCLLTHIKPPSFGIWCSRWSSRIPDLFFCCVFLRLVYWMKSTKRTILLINNLDTCMPSVRSPAAARLLHTKTGTRRKQLPWLRLRQWIMPTHAWAKFAGLWLPWNLYSKMPNNVWPSMKPHINQIKNILYIILLDISPSVCILKKMKAQKVWPGYKITSAKLQPEVLLYESRYWLVELPPDWISEQRQDVDDRGGRGEHLQQAVTSRAGFPIGRTTTRRLWHCGPSLFAVWP